MKSVLIDIIDENVAVKVGELIEQIAQQRSDEEDIKDILLTFFWVPTYTLLKHTNNLEATIASLNHILTITYESFKEENLNQ